MKTNLLLILLSVFCFTGMIKAQEVIEDWSNAFAEEQQGDNGEGTWLKTTYLWGHMNDETDLNQGFYTFGHETNDTTLYAHPVIKGVSDILWTLKRSYASYYVKLDKDNDERNLLRVRKNSSLESSVISGGLEWITVDMSHVPGAVLRVTLVSPTDSKVTLSHDFIPVEGEEEQVKLEVAGTPFEDMDEFIIRLGFASDNFFNLFNVTYMPKEGPPTALEYQVEEKPEIKNTPQEVILSGIPEGNYTVRVFNVSGREVYNDQVVNSPEVTIPKASLSNGVYILNVSGEYGEWKYKVLF